MGKSPRRSAPFICLPTVCVLGYLFLPSVPIKRQIKIDRAAAAAAAHGSPLSSCRRVRSHEELKAESISSGGSRSCETRGVKLFFQSSTESEPAPVCLHPEKVELLFRWWSRHDTGSLGPLSAVLAPSPNRPPRNPFTYTCCDKGGGARPTSTTPTRRRRKGDFNL